jgi:hypothetical protein
MPNTRHQTGDVCESILAEYLLRKGWWVFIPLGKHGPIDVIAITPEAEIFLFDSKADRFRKNPNRNMDHRIHRKRSNLQKQLNVRIAYVNENTREIHFVPSL